MAKDDTPRSAGRCRAGTIRGLNYGRRGWSEGRGEGEEGTEGEKLLSRCLSRRPLRPGQTRRGERERESVLAVPKSFVKAVNYCPGA